MILLKIAVNYSRAPSLHLITQDSFSLKLTLKEEKVSYF